MNEKKVVDKIEIDEAVQSIEEKSLVRWYRRWRNDPWTYAVVTALAKIPFYVLIAVVVSWERVKPFFNDPIAYLREKGSLMVIGFFMFVIIYHFAWKSKALKYFLFAKLGSHLPLYEDDRVGAYGQKASERLVIHYQRWGHRRWMLTATLALVLPVAFFAILFLLHGLKGNQWSWQVFFSNFEGGTDVAVFAIFFLFGALMGNGIWREVNENYHLMQKANANREH